MKIQLNAWSIFVIAFKRLRSQSRLTLAAAGGLIILIALVMSIPAYADAVSYRILSTDLMGGSSSRILPNAPRSPFIFMFHYKALFRGSTQWEQAQAVDHYLTGQAVADLGLPPKWAVRYLETFAFKLYVPEDVGVPAREKAFSWASFISLSDVTQHIKVIEGKFPTATPTASGSPIEVMVSDILANRMGLSVGETYIAYNQDAETIVQIPVYISGIWRAADPADLYWPFPPDELYNNLLVPEATIIDALAPNMKDELDQAVWSMALDSSTFHSADVPSFVNRITRVEVIAGSFLNGAYLKQSPKQMLLDYRQTTNLLTISLTAFSVPIATLLLAFINLVGSVTIERQRNEIAVMRSRGASLAQIAGISFLEGLLLTFIAVAAGIPVSKGILLLMGKTRSFLDFSLPASLRLDITSLSLAFGCIVSVLVIAARLLPMIGAARHTIITYKQERARNLRPPWWQRTWLDVLLFIPAIYGGFLLRRQGSILIPGAIPNDPFQNPLLILVPALGIFAATLFLLRLLPGFMSGIAWLAARTRSVSLLLASRHLSRTPGFYSVPLMLLILTLSLSAFTATLAQTLDNHYHDQQYYYSGADIRLVEYGQCLKFDPFGNCNVKASTETTPTWSFLPVSVHLKAPGVQAATRVGVWSAVPSTSGKVKSGTFMAIDRQDFTRVAFWRRDFALASLGSLMNDLAAVPNGVLVSSEFLRQEVLNIGDPLNLNVDIYGNNHSIGLKIAGSFDLFPTWYPNSGPLFVGNLDNFFSQIQAQQPYNVWLKAGAQVQCGPLVNTLRNPGDLSLDVQSCISAQQNITQEQKRPEHQGLFGLLSIGFAGAGLLTVLGFLLYALFSFQQRFIEMGVLRAIGLSTWQMILFLGWELVFLIGIGLAAGTGLGLLVSKLFIPYLQIGVNNASQIPPFVVEIAWSRIFQIYALFGVLFIAALAGLSTMLVRMKVFQAVKLGETA